MDIVMDDDTPNRKDAFGNDNYPPPLKARPVVRYNWRGDFTDRELAEIRFAQVYAKEFSHGTDGHNAKLIIAKLAALVERFA